MGTLEFALTPEWSKHAAPNYSSESPVKSVRLLEAVILIS